MKNQFVPYKIAVELEKLNFNEKCFAHYITSEGWKIDCKEGSLYYKTSSSNTKDKYSILAPLWQQAFKFLSTKFDINNSTFSIEFDQGDWLVFDFYDDEIQNIYRNEEGLKKLIGLCKNNL